MFIFFNFFHNNNGGFMKKLLFLLLFLTYDVSALGYVYVSKKDIDTNQFVNDCDFVIYDMNGNVVDSWVQDNSIHIASLDVGDYKLVERNSMSDFFREYDFNISDGIVEFTLYNQKIETPKNLGVNVNYSYFLIIIGFLIIFSCKIYCY